MSQDDAVVRAELPPAKPGFRQRVWDFPLTRILAFLALFAFLCVLLGLPLSWALRAAHIHLGPSEAGALTAETVAALASLGAFLVMVRRADGRSAASAGLQKHGLVRETALGLVLGGGLFCSVAAVLALLGVYHISGVSTHFRPLIPLLLFLMVAVSEEIIFRGYIFQTLEARWGTGIALAVSALFFGLVHLGNPIRGLTPGQRLIGPLYIVFEASILMTAGYLLTRRMWLPIGIHWGWNFFESAVCGTADSGFGAAPSQTLLHAHLSGPFYLSGGPFGPEASVACLVLSTLAGLLLLRQAIQKGQWRPRPRHSQFYPTTLEVLP